MLTVVCTLLYDAICSSRAVGIRHLRSDSALPSSDWTTLVSGYNTGIKKIHGAQGVKASSDTLSSREKWLSCTKSPIRLIERQDDRLP